jgi:hypothetical protein
VAGSSEYGDTFSGFVATDFSNFFVATVNSLWTKLPCPYLCPLQRHCQLNIANPTAILSAKDKNSFHIFYVITPCINMSCKRLLFTHSHYSRYMKSFGIVLSI